MRCSYCGGDMDEVEVLGRDGNRESVWVCSRCGRRD